MTDNFLKLNNAFERLTNSSHEGVQGVLEFKSLAPGPRVGITVCTHGNEPGGLVAADFLIEYLSAHPLLNGTLFIVLNNIEATRKYLNAKNEKQKNEARYLDVNMNRLPKNVLDIKNDKRYEIKRAQELYPIWKQFDIGLDIHSTTGFAEPMFISNGKNFEVMKNLVRGFPIRILISNIDKIQIGIPAFALYGNGGEEANIFAIEAGQHTQEETFRRVVQCSVALLQNLEMIKNMLTTYNTELQEYFIQSSIVFSDTSFDLIDDFQTFDEIKRGQTLARNKNGEEIKASFDGHIIMPTVCRGKDKDISEEVAFLSCPMRIRYLN